MTFITTEIVDHIAVITMDAPPVNAVSPAFMTEMITAFDMINDLDDIRVVVLTGAGKIFPPVQILRRVPHLSYNQVIVGPVRVSHAK